MIRTLTDGSMRSSWTTLLPSQPAWSTSGKKRRRGRIRSFHSPDASRCWRANSTSLSSALRALMRTSVAPVWALTGVRSRNAGRTSSVRSAARRQRVVHGLRLPSRDARNALNKRRLSELRADWGRAVASMRWVWRRGGSVGAVLSVRLAPWLGPSRAKGAVRPGSGQLRLGDQQIGEAE